MLSNVKIIQCGGRPVRQITIIKPLFLQGFFVSKARQSSAAPQTIVDKALVIKLRKTMIKATEIGLNEE